MPQWPKLPSQSQTHFLPQAEKFVLYSPYRTLAGRRPYKLGVFLAAETGKGTVEFAGRKRATIMQHGGDVTPPVEHRV